MTAHEALVEEVSSRLRALRAGEHVHVDKGGVHHFVPLPGDQRFRGKPVDISKLNRLLSIDVEARRAVAEPGLTFGALARATLEKGLLPKVVPELEGITVGGAIAGCSVESMSYRYGGFHDTAVEYEVVTTAGEVLTVSREKEPLLFEMIHGSYGTLGILTRATFDLVPAKPYVHMEYQTYRDAESFEAAILARSKPGDHDFVDAIVHSPTERVLCIGRFEDSAPYTSNYRELDIYYKSTREKREDHLSTVDYCFRYDTECHWLSRTVPPLEWRPVRRVLGGVFLGSTNMLKWAKRLQPLFGYKRRPDVVVDVFIPSIRFGDFLRWYDEVMAFYPLWVVPYRVPAPYPWIAPGHAAKMGTDLMMDCAVYGKVNSEAEVDYSEVLEKQTYSLGGIKTLISSNHHTEERFWQVYNKDNYLAAKKRLDPAGLFPDMFTKLHRR